MTAVPNHPTMKISVSVKRADGGNEVPSTARFWLAVFLLFSLWSPAMCAVNLTAAAAQVRLLQKATASQANNGGFFFTNIGPNSFEYRGMFAPGQTPVDFHKNFQELFDKFPEFPGFDFPKVLQQPNPTPAPVINREPPSPAYVPVQQPYVPVQQPYVPPTTVPPRRAPPALRAPKIIPQYELYRIRTTPAPQVKIVPPVGRQRVNQAPVQPLINHIPVQPLVNQIPVQPFVNQVPVQPHVNQIPVQPHVNQIPVQKLVNHIPRQPVVKHVPVRPTVNQAPVQPLINPALYRFSVPTIAPHIPQNPVQPLVNQVQPLINPVQPFVNQLVQPVQPHYRIPVPTIAPRIEHDDDQPYSNPEQQPFQFPVNFPEYHLVRGQTRAESYPKIFRFTDGRINIVDFERKKKKNQGKKVQYEDGLDPGRVQRDQFLILHGGYYPTDQSSDNGAKYDDNKILYDNINDVQGLQKLSPNLAFYYQK